MLGHTNVRMTQVYAMVTQDKLFEEAYKLTVDEIADMLFVSSATVFRVIRNIYNKGVAREEDTHNPFRLFPYHPNWNIDVYNLEMVIRLAYAINSDNSHKFFDERSGKADYRQFIMNRLMGRPMYANVCIFEKMS